MVSKGKTSWCATGHLLLFFSSLLVLPTAHPQFFLSGNANISSSVVLLSRNRGRGLEAGDGGGRQEGLLAVSVNSGDHKRQMVEISGTQSEQMEKIIDETQGEKATQRLEEMKAWGGSDTC